MNHLRQACWWPVFCVAGQCLISPLPAEIVTNVPAPVKSAAVPANLLPPPLPQLPHSPVDFFRQLLAMTPKEQEAYLTNRPPEVRERLRAKVREYRALDPNERELRLRATELRWYLLPFLRESPTNHAARLAQLPDDIRELVKSRVDEWDALSPQLRQEFLDNEHILRYFAHVDSTNRPPPEPGQHPGPSDSEQARWNALSEDERKSITVRFNQFFELTPVEKQKALNTLSEMERQQMEKTLQTFDKMPPAQRLECIHAFAKFADLRPAERAEFLKNAQRWSQMSPTERQAWRDLVTHVPQWPPLPSGLIMPPSPPPLPPPLPPRVRPVVATNR
jgi:predicted Fe-S protein YdhL (DUF1289 family)